MKHLNAKPILEYMEEHKLNKKQFCELCDISLYHLNKILYGYNGDIQVKPIYNICVLTGIRYDTIIEPLLKEYDIKKKKKN